MTDEDPVPASRLLGATFTTWARALPWIVPAIAVLCAPAIALLATRGGGWPMVAAGLAGEAVAWAVVMPRVIAAARGRPGGGSIGAGLVAAPRVVVALAIAYAPVIAIVLSIQFGRDVMIELVGRWVTMGLVVMALPLAALLLALELQARWIVLVPLLVDGGRGLGLREAQRMTLEHRSALQAAVLVLGAIAVGVFLLASPGIAIAHERWTWSVFWAAMTASWLIVGTLRLSLAAASYVAFRDRVTPADLGRVFE